MTGHAGNWNMLFRWGFHAVLVDRISSQLMNPGYFLAFAICKAHMIGSPVKRTGA